MSPTAPVPEPSSSTDRRLSAWAPSPANPGVSRYLERTMAASQTTQPTPPEPYCCSRNTVPSRFSKTRTKFRSGSSPEDSREAAIAARQQEAPHAATSHSRALFRAPPCQGPGASRRRRWAAARARRHKARMAALFQRGQRGAEAPLRAKPAHSSPLNYKRGLTNGQFKSLFQTTPT